VNTSPGDAGDMANIDMALVPDELKAKLRQAQDNGDSDQLEKLGLELQKYRKNESGT
jgi:hypothetical protein